MTICTRRKSISASSSHCSRDYLLPSGPVQSIFVAVVSRHEAGAFQVNGEAGAEANHPQRAARMATNDQLAANPSPINEFQHPSKQKAPTKAGAFCCIWCRK